MSKSQKTNTRLITSLMLLTLLISAIISTNTLPVFAALGNVTNVTRNGDTLTISIGSDTLTVQACKPELLKVDYFPGGASSPDTAIIGNTSWSAVGATIDTASNPMTVTTSKMVVKINKTPCRLSVYDTVNTLLLKEQDAEGVYNDGVKFNYLSGSNFYGIGGFDAWETSTAGILRNSGGAVHAGAQGDCGAPFVWSNKGYGVLIDSDGGSFSITGTDLNFSGCSKNDIEYYVAVGKPAEILAAVADLSGKPPMLPKWAMGFGNCEWGINQSELLSTIDTYRSKQEPIDLYIVDYDWFLYGADNWGDFTWNSGNFPDGASGNLCNNLLASRGIKLATIRKPRLPNNTVQRQDAISKGYMYGTSDEFNYSTQAARDWWWTHSKALVDTGINGYWNDEADNNGNFHFMDMQRTYYDGQRSYVNKRVWSINRNFYLGGQRYAYALWSGDINTGFSVMADQRERMLSAINLGEAKWGMDTGGFNGTPGSENYARWMQFSAFVPIFRVHGTSGEQRQPWRYGTTAEAAVKNVMQLRYKLIPYIYSFERQSYDTGVGLVKSLVFDNPSDTNVTNYKDAWMFGDYLLVAPVITQGQTSKSIYLPAGTWIDYFRGTTYNGDQTINYTVDSATWNDVPLFIKKGAIIPTMEQMNYVGEKSLTKVYVDVFPNTSQTGLTYYDDDGLTYNYESGVYFKQAITAQDNGSSVSLNIAAKTGSYTPALQYYINKVHGRAATGVTINGASVTKYNNIADLENASGEGWATASDIYGNATWVKVAAGSAKNIVVTGSGNPDPTPSPLPTPSPTPGPVRYEAESGQTNATISSKTEASGGQYVGGLDNVGMYVTVTVNVPSAGNYKVSIGYANGKANTAYRSLYVNGTHTMDVDFPVTGSWLTFVKRAALTLALNAGNNTLKIQTDTGDAETIDVDYFDVEPAGGATPTPTPTSTPTPTGTPTPTPASTPTNPPGGTTISFQQGTNDYTGAADVHLMEYNPGSNTGGNDRFEICRYSGSYDNDEKQGLLRFDVSSIPSNATITSATVDLTLVECRNGTATKTIEVHKLSRAWGEGVKTGIDGAAATSGECSWTYSASTTQWTTPGGDYDSTAADTKSIAATAGTVYSWNVTGMVQGWVTNSATNYGMIFVEALPKSISNGTKAFAAKEYATVTSRPKLTVIYTTGSTATPTPTPTPTPAPAATAIPTPSPAPGSGSDEFNSGTLGSQWSWVREDNTMWSLTASSGYLRIITQTGDLWQTTNDMKNILLQTAPAGDYTVVTKLTFSPTANFHQAGIIVHADDDNHLIVNRIYNGGNKFTFKKEVAGVVTENTVADTLGATVYLKLVKSGTSYSGYYSGDGSTWTQIASTFTGVTFTNPKVGLHAANGGASATSINADFDYFQIN